MKNVQVIDAADNCTYSVYQVTDDQFAAIFPSPYQDIEFIEDLVERLGADAVEKVFKSVWTREIKKPEVQGIHGTLFYELSTKRKFYPNKKESDIAENSYRLID